MDRSEMLNAKLSDNVTRADDCVTPLKCTVEPKSLYRDEVRFRELGELIVK